MRELERRSPRDRKEPAGESDARLRATSTEVVVANRREDRQVDVERVVQHPRRVLEEPERELAGIDEEVAAQVLVVVAVRGATPEADLGRALLAPFLADRHGQRPDAGARDEISERRHRVEVEVIDSEVESRRAHDAPVEDQRRQQVEVEVEVELGVGADLEADGLRLRSEIYTNDALERRIPRERELDGVRADQLPAQTAALAGERRKPDLLQVLEETAHRRTAGPVVVLAADVAAIAERYGRRILEGTAPEVRPQVVLRVVADLEDLVEPEQAADRAVGTRDTLVEEAASAGHGLAGLIVELLDQLALHRLDLVGEEVDRDVSEVVENAADATEVGGEARGELTVEEVGVLKIRRAEQDCRETAAGVDRQVDVDTVARQAPGVRVPADVEAGVRLVRDGGAEVEVDLPTAVGAERQQPVAEVQPDLDVRCGDGSIHRKLLEVEVEGVIGEIEPELEAQRTVEQDRQVGRRRDLEAAVEQLRAEIDRVEALEIEARVELEAHVVGADGQVERGAVSVTVALHHPQVRVDARQCRDPVVLEKRLQTVPDVARGDSPVRDGRVRHRVRRALLEPVDRVEVLEDVGVDVEERGSARLRVDAAQTVVVAGAEQVVERLAEPRDLRVLETRVEKVLLEPLDELAELVQESADGAVGEPAEHVAEVRRLNQNRLVDALVARIDEPHEQLLEAAVRRIALEGNIDVHRVRVNPQRRAGQTVERAGDAEDVELERQKDIEAAVNACELDVVAEQGLVETEEPVVLHAGALALVEDERDLHEVRVIVGIAELRVRVHVAVDVDVDVGVVGLRVEIPVRRAAGVVVQVELHPVDGTHRDRVENRELERQRLADHLEAGLDLGSLFERVVPVEEELVDRIALRPGAEVDAGLDAQVDEGREVDRPHPL